MPLSPGSIEKDDVGANPENLGLSKVATGDERDFDAMRLEIPRGQRREHLVVLDIDDRQPRS
jgi:hypothetical protein